MKTNPQNEYSQCHLKVLHPNSLTTCCQELVKYNKAEKKKVVTSTRIMSQQGSDEVKTNYINKLKKIEETGGYFCIHITTKKRKVENMLGDCKNLRIIKRQG